MMTELETCTIWWFLIFGLVYADNVNYKYKIENDCYHNYNYYDYYNRRTCTKFVSTEITIQKFQCYLHDCNTLQNLNLYNKGILRLLNNPSTNETEISRNDIPALQKMKNILVLDLSENKIEKILPGTFTAFSQLVELNLTMNCLTALDTTLLSPVFKLQKLNISRNSITIVSQNAFANQENLFVVDLSFNNISYIPKEVFTTQEYLEEVLLRGNQIKQFELQLKQSNNPVQSFPIDPFLDLSYNLLETVVIPEYFTSISISHNNLSIFSSVVPSAIKSLDLSYNNIKVIHSKSFANATNLYRLNLSHNILTSLPTNSFKDVKFLEYLDVSHNLIYEHNYGTDNNWISFLLNFNNLREVALEGNYWKCPDLKELIYISKSHGGEVLLGNTYNSTNILGIGCTDVNKNVSNKEITFTPFEQIQSVVNQQIADEIHSLYLNYTALKAMQDITSELELKFQNLTQQLLEIFENETSKETVITQRLASMENKILELSDIKYNISDKGSSNNFIEQIRFMINQQMADLIHNLYLNCTALQAMQNNILELKLQNLGKHFQEIFKNKTSNVTTLTQRLDSVEHKILELRSTLKPVNITPQPTTGLSTMEHINQNSNTQVTESTGIITNICLVIIICCFIYFLYVNCKHKHLLDCPQRETLNLV